ncbi:teneurin-2-like, partial [Nelusetta ayraudi]|uniref:teneurin-2-like n=1 Tax=Nelusetta ayraudi TaxID=303726 RepID=UPI003F712949
MDLKDRRHRSLTRGRCSKDSQYNTASLEADECRVPTQKSYSSSETLKAFDHEQRLHYSGCVSDLVHHEADEYSRQGGNFTLAELGVCEPTPAPHPAAVPYCPDLGLLQRGYSLSAGSDADSDPEGPLSPERAIQLWAGQGRVKSRRSSGVSSHENSALTLTDSDNDNKSDDESAYLDDEEDEDPFGDYVISKSHLIVSSRLLGPQWTRLPL